MLTFENARQYHSTTILVPDGRIMVAGSVLIWIRSLPNMLQIMEWNDLYLLGWRTITLDFGKCFNIGHSLWLPLRDHN